MKYVLVNDIHLSDRPPSSCTDSYLDDLFALLDEVARLAASQDAAIVFAGDVFHHKTPGRTSHSTVLRLIDWARTALVPIYTVLGNHDLSHDRIDSIAETQPLGVCIASGAIRLLDGMIEDEYEEVFGVPWQMTFDDASVFDALEQFRALRPDIRAKALVVAHAPLYPPGEELPYEFYPAAKWAEAMGNKGTVHYGHVHSPHGVYVVDGVTFSNCGALSRGSLTENNLTRAIQVAVWDSETGGIEHVTLHHRPAEEVFRLPEVQAQKAAQVDLSTFLDNVGGTELSITSTEVVIDYIRSLGLNATLEDLLRALLDEADA